MPYLFGSVWVTYKYKIRRNGQIIDMEIYGRRSLIKYLFNILE